MIFFCCYKGGLDVNKPNRKNEYPIELIIRHNKINVLRSILKRSDLKLNQLKNGYCPLIDACEKDLTDMSMLLIDAGADLNIVDDDENDDGENWTPIMHAVSNNNEVLVSRLVEKGADLSLSDSAGNTVVHMAVLNDNEFILSLLLARNAPKNALNDENCSPIDLAKLNESEECIRLLS